MAIVREKIVPIVTRRPVVKQRDLAELELLRIQAWEAAAAYREARRTMREAIEAGAEVEPGIRTAKIQMRRVLTFR